VLDTVLCQFSPFSHFLSSSCPIIPLKCSSFFCFSHGHLMDKCTMALWTHVLVLCLEKQSH
jgi:hypothetical protein